MNGLPELKTYGTKDILQTALTGYQLSNLKSQRGLAELGMKEKLEQAKRLEAEETRKAATYKTERELAAVKYGARLLHNVTDDASYKDALFRFSQAYPEYAKTIPQEYDPATVRRMVGWGLAYEKMSDQRSAVGKLLKERDALPIDDPNRAVLDQRIAKEISREGFTVVPDGKGSFTVTKEEDVSEKVKQAQSFIVKFANSIDPTIAMIIAANPKRANDPTIKAMLETKIPENLKGAYDEAVKILNEFYGATQEPGSAPSGVTHVFEPGKGLLPVE